ncbi:MAG: AtpZ/AtpI family protein [candidate division Zixibacteria bacterium]|nr:AtpZ/AtpI family protein [candidate division Zixibacteria bacterium]
MPDFKRPSERKGKNDYRQIGLLTTIPILLAVGPLVGFFIGRWLDSKFGTEPYLMVLFLVFGFVASGREIYRLLKRTEEENEKKS